MDCKFKLIILTVFSCLSSMSCATYSAKPLPEAPSLVPDLAGLENRPLLESKGVQFNDGIDGSEIVVLALELNPDLKLARDDELIAERSMAAYSPTNQITLGYGAILGQAIGTYDAGVGFDIASLLSMPSRYRMERKERQKATLSRIWQEWQTAQQARILFAQTIFQKKIIATLDETAAIMNQKIEHMDEALKAGNVPITVVAVELAARSDIRSKLNDAEKTQLQTQASLNALLGFAPDFVLDLKDEFEVKEPRDADVENALKTMARRRPDLAAIAVSYQLQEEKVYQAVLAQFPSLSLSFNRTRDNSNVTDSIVSLSLNLPLFYRGKDAVLLEEATRQRQWDEYQNRLNAAAGELKGLLRERRLLTQQIAANKVDLPRLESVSTQASSALISGNIDALTFSDLRMAYLNRRLEFYTLEELLVERNIAIETLVGHTSIEKEIKE